MTTTIRFSRSCKLHRAAETLAGRYAFNTVCLRDRRLVATNGKILASVAVEGLAEDESPDALLSLDVIKEATKGRGDAELIINETSVALPNGSSYPLVDAGAFPDSQPIIKDLPDPSALDVTVIKLNPKLLWDLSQALGASDGVRLVIESPATAIRVEPLEEGRDVIGALMPIWES